MGTKINPDKFSNHGEKISSTLWDWGWWWCLQGLILSAHAPCSNWTPGSRRDLWQSFIAHKGRDTHGQKGTVPAYVWKAGIKLGRIKQRHNRVKTGTRRDKAAKTADTNQARTKQGQPGTIKNFCFPCLAHDCPCFVPACPCIPCCPFLCPCCPCFVPACPCFVPACPCFVPACPCLVPGH